ncbi:probable cytochrome P450 311a1 [Drosophila pseudoobscura]|uniref:Probable cytochrome P450 311a1 n=1 Tax=Drosophila pseudoobscura pseudoobscura TaxID=46245 RepID=A0A6I8UYP1_DROPS|nr:probable cytochrome P450 311a1 [Drosophila pseudoobscura]
MPCWVLLLVGLGLLLLLQKWALLRLGSSLPGPWAFPLLGNAQMVGKLRPEFIFLVFTELRDRFGATYRLWLGPQLWVFLHTAEETREALHDPTLRKAKTFLQLEPLIGNGLLISHGSHWTQQRRLLTPAFRPTLLRSFAPSVAKHADRLIQRLEETRGSFLEVTDPLFACLLDAIVDTSMGEQLETQSVAHSPIIKAFHRSSQLLFKRMINPLLASDWVFKQTRLWRELSEQLQVIHTLMDSLIDRRSAQLQQQGNEPRKALNLLDTLLLANIDGEPLSRKEIRDEINTFVFAGVDTTTAAMSFVLYALAMNPEAQDRLQEELRQLPPGISIDLDTLNELPYLDALLKEVLRLYTIVPTTGRQTTRSTVIGGRTYCAGVTLWINMYGLAHDASYFPDPYVFKPERWMQETELQAEVPFSYIPFSGGPHVCIGRRYALLLMKLLTARIARAFQLELRPGQPELTLQAQMVLKTREGIHLAFTKR